jgi:hypothetical protein
LSLGLARRLHARNPHQLQQLFTVLVLLAGHADRAARKLLDFLRGAGFLRLGVAGLGRRFARNSFRELAGFQRRWFAVEDVERPAEGRVLAGRVDAGGCGRMREWHT